MSFRCTSLAQWRLRALGFSLAACLSLPAWAAPVTETPAPAAASADAIAQLLVEQGYLQRSGALAPTPESSSDLAIQEWRDQAADMVMTAMNFLGVPYRRGGNTPAQGFDCSGFTRYVFQQAVGMVLPRRADDQANSPRLARISREELKPGDLVFFNTMRRTFSHVGIYIGDNKFIHAPRTGKDVRVEDMNMRYWTNRFTGGRRAVPPKES